MTDTNGSGQSVPFIHLRVHSAYSLLEGALTISKIVDFALASGSPAIGICDTNNLFGALEFAQKASKAGIQPVIGCQIAIDFCDAGQGGVPSRRYDGSLPSILLIASNEQGHANLVRLVSRAYMETPSGEPVHIQVAWLEELANGMIVLSGGMSGPFDELIGTAREAAMARLNRLRGAFADRLYIELQRPQGYDKSHEAKMVLLAYETELPLVATNEAFFLKREDFESHDALMAIAAGALMSEDNRRRVTPDNYLRSPADMAKLFADLPEAIANTSEIAQRCSYYTQGRSPILPRFTGANGDGDAALSQEAAELKRQAHIGLAERLTRVGPVAGYTDQDYRERLDFELSVIERMKYPGLLPHRCRFH